jgi:hypothetical protein
MKVLLPLSTLALPPDARVDWPVPTKAAWSMAGNRIVAIVQPVDENK